MRLRLKGMGCVSIASGDGLRRFPLPPRSLSSTILSLVPTGNEFTSEDSGERSTSAPAEDTATRMGTGLGADADAGRSCAERHLDGESGICGSRRDMSRAHVGRGGDYAAGALPGGGGMHSVSPAVQHAGWVGGD